MWKYVHDHKSTLTVVLVALIAAVVFGGLIGLSFYIVAAPLLAIILVGALMYHPKLSLWTVIILALVAVGLIELFIPQLRHISWAVALLSFGLAIVATTKRIMSSDSTRFAGSGSLIIVSYGIFVLTIFASAIPRGNIDGALASSLKGYLQAAGVLLAVYWIGLKAADLGRLMKFIALLTIVQLPLVIYQVAVLAPQRTAIEYAYRNIVAVDIVAGTFGGFMHGGGRGLNLAILCLVGGTYILTCWKLGLITTRKMLLGGALCLLPIMLSEVKIVIILIPVALLMIFGETLKKSLAKSISAVGVTSLLLAIILATYTLLPSAESQKSDSLGSLIEETISYNFGARGYGSAELNRTTVYTFWIKENILGGSLADALIGHGPGSTHSGSAVAETSHLTAKYHKVGIGLTGLSVLLWELGIIGAASAISVFIIALRVANKLTKNPELRNYMPAIVAAKVGIVACGISLLHSGYFIFDLPHQVMLMLFLGVIASFAHQNPSLGPNHEFSTHSAENPNRTSVWPKKI